MATGKPSNWTQGSKEPLGCWGRDRRGRPGLGSCVFTQLLCELGEGHLPGPQFLLLKMSVDIIHPMACGGTQAHSRGPSNGNPFPRAPCLASRPGKATMESPRRAPSCRRRLVGKLMASFLPSWATGPVHAAPPPLSYSAQCTLYYWVFQRAHHTGAGTQILLSPAAN